MDSLPDPSDNTLTDDELSAVTHAIDIYLSLRWKELTDSRDLLTEAHQKLIRQTLARREPK